MVKIAAIRPKCGIEGCTLFHYAKGYCQVHYNRVWQSKTGAPNMTKKVGKPINKRKRGRCTFVGCNIVHFAKGLCQKHYNTVRSTQIASTDQRKCSIEGCQFIHNAKGLCYHHGKLLSHRGYVEKIKANSDTELESA